MFGQLVGGAGCVSEQGNEGIGCLLADLRVFGSNAPTAAQDGGEWRQTAEQGAACFMAE